MPKDCMKDAFRRPQGCLKDTLRTTLDLSVTKQWKGVGPEKVRRGTAPKRFRREGPEESGIRYQPGGVLSCAGGAGGVVVVR